jgi:hypothetical protein
MRLAGCHTISFGVEVPTDAGLTLFGKRELMERVEFAFRNAREARLRVQAILVFGAPEDRSTFEDVFTTLAGLKPDSLQSYLYHPVPGSPWWRKFGSTINLATTEGWSTLDFHSPPILGGGYTHQRDAIGRFLASLVWSASPLTVRGRQLREHLQEGYACPRCAAEVKANILDAHDNVIVFGLHSDAGELLIAAGPSEIVAHPLHGRDNLYEGLFWCMDVQPDEAMIRLCPRCGILPDFSERDVGEITTYGERESAFTGGAT